ncbi:MAG TPA: oxidoreductase, partial [Armatimonadota bacterium]
RTSEQLEMAELLRRKAKVVVAFGSCAHTGGIPGLANLTDAESILYRAYEESPSTVNPEKIRPQVETKVPEGTVTLPSLDNTVKALDMVIPVEFYLPGCPPPPALILNAVMAILKNELPPVGSVLAPDIALCDTCERKDSKPDKPLISGFKRPHLAIADPEKCLLAQGFVCLGPATRSGCDNACIKGNMPCTGCGGPTSNVRDYGGKALSAIASLLDCGDDAEIEKQLDQIPDPVGTFNRYSLPASFLYRRVKGGS